MVCSMVSFTELLLSFWGYALETVTKLLNMTPSKTVTKTPYVIWHRKPASYKYLRVWGSPVTKGVCFEKYSVLEKGFSTGYPRSTRVSQPPNRYGLLVIGQLDNYPQTYEEAISDINSGKWLEAMRFELESISSNNIWTLVSPPKGFKLIRCKWVYKRKLGAEGEVITFKASLVAKDYTQRPSVDFEETYSPIAMSKSIWILLVISSYDEYEICQINVKTLFFNGFIEEEIYIDQLGFISIGEKQKVRRSSVVFVVLYLDDILLIGHDDKMLGDTKAWLSMQFSMTDLGDASDILGVSGGELVLEGYSHASFQSIVDDVKSQSDFVFKRNGGMVAWKSFKKDTTIDYTTEAEYIAVSKAAKEAVWMKNYIQEFGVMPSIIEPIYSYLL
ncbi:UNVERIFIED_CONTAM: Copia protein [Sesamum calycinum]|uniref:Copia protein n=1 Tax=Sesamum calycinum TaxID=2727403 RepID=A0AAW2NV12_9LAMI